MLDFGLAKMLDTSSPTAVSANVTNSPTLATGTRVGVILGTAAYMAPEQARGKMVDKRADIWAFGCVLFEMITGRRPFGADDVAETLAFIITREPDWSTLPADWSEDEIEILEVEYTLPKPTAKDLSGEERKYFGYVVSVYYRGELQDMCAEPVSLLKQFPPALTLQNPS